MADSLIRWKRGDYVKLSKAVASFNRKINELDVNEAKYLPDLKDYKELRDTIMSRKELNRIVKALRNFNVEGAETRVILPSGQAITKWEYHELKLARNRAIRQLETEKASITLGNKWKGMGDERIDQINATIKHLYRLEESTGGTFASGAALITKLGSFDRGLNEAEQFRVNFMNALEELSTYDNYELLREKLESIKNPEQFYDYIRNSEVLSDLFLYYKDKATAQTYGGFSSNQDAFNYALEELGLMK